MSLAPAPGIRRRTCSARRARGAPGRPSSIRSSHAGRASTAPGWHAAATFRSPNGGLDDPPASSALDYEPVGSLAGTLRVKDRAVDFGASDMPLKPDELAALGLAQFPIVVGGVVVAVNVDGVPSGRLKLTGPVLADIFLGKIASWSDPAIAAINPDLSLPDAPIAVIHRSDGSGTTFNFTDYLSAVSPEWKLRAGSDLLVPGRPAPAPKGTRASRGRSSHAELDRLPRFRAGPPAGLAHALVQNRAGRFVTPDAASFQAAAAGADWQPQRLPCPADEPAGEQAYPIAATVFALMHRTASRTRTRAALDFFRWSLGKGSAIARSWATCRCRPRSFSRSKATGRGPSRPGADAGVCTSGRSQPPARWKWD